MIQLLLNLIEFPNFDTNTPKSDIWNPKFDRLNPKFDIIRPNFDRLNLITNWLSISYKGIKE